nr:hypothetical protein CFP56_74886 [Quercus suber]
MRFQSNLDLQCLSPEKEARFHLQVADYLVEARLAVCLELEKLGALERTSRQQALVPLVHYGLLNQLLPHLKRSVYQTAIHTISFGWPGSSAIRSERRCPSMMTMLVSDCGQKVVTRAILQKTWAQAAQWLGLAATVALNFSIDFTSCCTISRLTEKRTGHPLKELP